MMDERRCLRNTALRASMFLLLSLLTTFHTSIRATEDFLIAVANDSLEVHEAHDDRCASGIIPFREPHVVASENGFLALDLVVDVTRYIGVVSFNTRLYNDSLPGPTIIVKPGDSLQIRLINNLDEEVEEDWDAVEYHSPNTTSLHLHGMHVSPQGNADYIFEGVGPGHSHLYTYNIPEDHYPGTHWYHAHYHGSSAFQVMGGMAGAIIVAPPSDDWLPPEYANLHWHVVVLQVLRWDAALAGFLSISSEIGNLVDPQMVPCIVPGELNTAMYVVNGIYEPVLSMAVGEYRVFQLIHAAGDIYALELVISNPEVCSIWTIGKDGVFFDKAISEHVVFLWGGNRADILVRCSEPGRYSITNNGSDPANDWFFGVEKYVTRIHHNLMWIDVQERDTSSDSDSSDEAEALASSETFTEIDFDTILMPERPFYLHDLIDIPTSEIDGFFNIIGSYDSLALNGARFSSPTNYSFYMELDKVYQISFLADNYSHPMHVHVNHFQITSIDPYGDLGDYNEDWMVEHSEFLWNRGEWRDTIPSLAGYNITVRFRTDAWWGPVPVHCHYLPHTDRGMLLVMFIADPDGPDAAEAEKHTQEMLSTNNGEESSDEDADAFSFEHQ